jgi:hypothetical protein
MRLALSLLFALTIAACSTAPRTVDKPARPGTVTPPTEEVETEEEGEPDPEDAPVQEVPVLPDTTQRWSGNGQLL